MKGAVPIGTYNNTEVMEARWRGAVGISSPGTPEIDCLKSLVDSAIFTSLIPRLRHVCTNTIHKDTRPVRNIPVADIAL